MRCPNCAAPAAGAAFCPRCGAALAPGDDLDGRSRGIWLLQQGDTPRAIAALQQAIADEPPAADLYLLLATAHLRLSERESAEKALRVALRLDPERAVTHAYLGSLLFEQGRFEEAADALDEALLLGPDESLVRLKRGEYFLRLGRLQEASDELTRAVQLPAPDPSANRAARALLTEARTRNKSGFVRRTDLLPRLNLGGLWRRVRAARPGREATEAGRAAEAI